MRNQEWTTVRGKRDHRSLKESLKQTHNFGSPSPGPGLVKESLNPILMHYSIRLTLFSTLLVVNLTSAIVVKRFFDSLKEARMEKRNVSPFTTWISDLLLHVTNFIAITALARHLIGITTMEQLMHFSHNHLLSLVHLQPNHNNESSDEEEEEEEGDEFVAEDNHVGKCNMSN
ncbi:hypothetical protein L2E82_21014 [Cichorium intybus]|uniref:Uncharacterized protein n=1 Tax=Cichorium intybus TaxID=13427 RepID=A0ACB9DUQ2_CICIN|nr:hypothetical protein L2E82_21014 [Cichorium intybus]